MIAAHELAHGLGFKSGLVSFAKDVGKILLAPRVQNIPNHSFFEPLSAFDSMVFYDNESLVQVADTLATSRIPDNQKYSGSIEEWPGNFKVCTDLYDMASSGMLSLKLPKTKINLEKLTVIREHEVLFYVSFNSQYDQEIVVGNDVEFKGKTLAEEMPKRGMDGVFGPRTVQIFEEIGYLTAASIQVPRFKLATNIEQADYSPPSAPFSMKPKDWVRNPTSSKQLSSYPLNVAIVSNDNSENSDYSENNTENDDILYALTGPELMNTFGDNHATDSNQISSAYRFPPVAPQKFKSNQMTDYREYPKNQPRVLYKPMLERPSKRIKNEQI